MRSDWTVLRWVCLRLLHDIYKPSLWECDINPLLVYRDLFGFRRAVAFIPNPAEERKSVLFWLFSLFSIPPTTPPSHHVLCALKANILEV